MKMTMRLFVNAVCLLIAFSSCKGNSSLSDESLFVAVTELSLDNTTLDLKVGETKNLIATVTPKDATDKTVTWNSSDDKIATVDSTGKVTAVVAGSAIITATTSGGEKVAKCELNVTEPIIMRLLSVGNSYSQDALAYVPFILKNMGIEEVRIGILMQSSSTIQMHVENFINEDDAFTFYMYDVNSNSWSNLGHKTIQWALDNYEWNCISLQQSSNWANSSWSDYQPWCNDLINLVSAYIDYPVKFIWYQPQTRPARINSGDNLDEATIIQRYENTTNASKRIIEETRCEYVVPVGTAMQNARTITSLKAMGDYAANPLNTSGLGYLECNDGVHAQEGLPCQLQAYTFILALLDIYGLNEYSINGESTRVDADWVAGKAIPGPHGSPIGSTDENCLLAQKCAIMAIKNPYEITDMNYLVNSE